MSTRRPLGALCIALLSSACSVTGHPSEPATLGVARPLSALEAVLDEPGPVRVETVVAADWKVPLEGMLNLEHPRAQNAGLEAKDEPIQIYLHALRHPEHGLFLIDSGVQAALRDDPERAVVRGLVAKLAGVGSLEVRVDTRSWLERAGAPLAGVFLTHLHLDHILGLPDVPRGTPLYTGPGEAEARALLNLFVQHVSDRALEGHAALAEWRFEPEPGGGFDGSLDVFGDGSVWALHVPGHTPGSTAFVVRTPEGPVLFTGDACHTAWGWLHEVEPGTFSSDGVRSRESLLALRGLAERHARLDVRLGHQALAPQSAHGAAH